MARIDFYVLRQSGEQARQTFACRLAEKAYRSDCSVHILAPDAASAQHMDDLLWTFRDGSFVPHEQTSADKPTPSAPVSVGCDADNATPRDLLITLLDEAPPCIDAYPRIAELVGGDEQSKQSSRRRFAQYREQGHSLDTHQV